MSEIKKRYGRRLLGQYADGSPYYEERTPTQTYVSYGVGQGASSLIGAMAPWAVSQVRNGINGMSGGFSDLADRHIVGKSLDPQMDPALKKMWIKDGSSPYGFTSRVAKDVISQNIPQDTSDWTPADISGAGGFKRALQAYRDGKLTSIGTVTPEPQSRRFGSTGPGSGNHRGAAGTDMLWGNPGKNQYQYGDSGTNPSIHFSGAELRPEEKGPYQYTGDAITAAEKGKRTTWGSKNGPNSDHMFGFETRKVGGLVTSGDAYTALREMNVIPEPKGVRTAGQYFRYLGDRLAQELDTTPYKALEALASPHPVSGETTRQTGSVPESTRFRFADATPQQLRRVGLGRKGIFEANSDPFDKRYLDLDGLETDLNLQFKDINTNTGVGRWLKRPAGGAIAVATQTPEIAKSLRDGMFGDAAVQFGMAMASGEAMQMGVNRLVKAGLNRGVTWPAQLAAGASQVVTGPAAAIGALDTASTLATGKNVRELAVESGNTGPAIATMMAPQTMAPLGHAGGPVQATVPMTPERKANLEHVKKLEANAAAARKRGGRWAFAGMKLPEFGLSELLEIN